MPTIKKRHLVWPVVATFIIVHAYARLPKPACSTICGTQQSTYDRRCISVGNHKLYYRKQGHGRPAVVFSSGTGFSADEWFTSGIASEIAKHHQVIAYDRLYTFNSCLNANDYMPRTAQDVVYQLRQLLNQLKIPPPYILVGHSFGGLYMLLFAKQHPEEVAGLLLMDATSSDGPTPLPKGALPLLREQGNPQNPSPNSQLYNEEIGQLPSYLQLQAAAPLKRDIPLIIMYASKHCLPSALTQGKHYCMTKEEEENHVRQQMKMYRMSDYHALYKLDGGHMSFFDTSYYPTVLKAFERLLTMVQALDTSTVSS